MAWRLWAVLAFACAVSSCKEPSPDERFVRQKMPVAIEAGKPITIEVSPGGSYANLVGLRCSREIWKALSQDPKKIVVRLKSPDNKKLDDKRIEISGVSPRPDGSLWGIESFHYLFQISGKRNAKAKVEIIFPTAPPGITRAEIIVENTPIDTKPFGFLRDLAALAEALFD
jgi:hypothetical protein